VMFVGYRRQFGHKVTSRMCVRIAIALTFAKALSDVVTPLVRVVLYDHIASYNSQSLQSIVSPHVCVRMSMFIHFV